MTRDEELARMQDPDRWPLRTGEWGQLPVRRQHGSRLEVGVIVESTSRVLASPPLVNPWIELRGLFEENTEDRLIYATFEELYDDGWRIE